MVAIKKQNGNLRICFNKRGYKQPHYAIPTTEEILLKMGGAKRLTKLDASNAY